MQERQEAGRYQLRVFEGHKGAKLDWPKVRELRKKRADGASTRTLAAAYDIDDSMVLKILANKFWKVEKDPNYGIK